MNLPSLLYRWFTAGIDVEVYIRKRIRIPGRPRAAFHQGNHLRPRRDGFYDVLHQRITHLLFPDSCFKSSGDLSCNCV